MGHVLGLAAIVMLLFAACVYAMLCIGSEVDDARERALAAAEVARVAAEVRRRDEGGAA